MSTTAPVAGAISPIRPARKARAEPTWHHAGVLEHRRLADRYQHLRLHAPSIAALTQPGQFVMLTVARHNEQAPVLPRPMAVYARDTDAGTIEVIYGVVGDGTRRLTSFDAGERMLVVGPLGQGFDLDPDAAGVLLVGRGIGTCSLTTVAQELARTDTRVVAVASGRDETSVIGATFYREHGAAVYEVDDAAGTSSVAALRRRLIEDLDDRPPAQIMTCGSERLARLCRELAVRWEADVQVSLEAHMACGLGYCHGCATGARADGDESPLICADGPVFRYQQVVAA